jgi:glycyl-tRNA synthetase beta chain
VDTALFAEEQEQKLYDAFVRVEEAEYSGYGERLDALFGLKAVLDEYFDNVLVNADDDALRNNRKKMIASVYRAFLDIADIKEISV